MATPNIWQSLLSYGQAVPPATTAFRNAPATKTGLTAPAYKNMGSPATWGNENRGFNGIPDKAAMPMSNWWGGEANRSGLPSNAGAMPNYAPAPAQPSLAQAITAAPSMAAQSPYSLVNGAAMSSPVAANAMPAVDYGFGNSAGPGLGFAGSAPNLGGGLGNMSPASDPGVFADLWGKAKSINTELMGTRDAPGILPTGLGLFNAFSSYGASRDATNIARGQLDLQRQAFNANKAVMDENLQNYRDREKRQADYYAKSANKTQGQG